jgi:peptidoglycan/LPS O-acetylase OafA/YrhL
VRSSNRTIDCIRALAAGLVVASHLRALLFPDYADTSQSMAVKTFYGLTSLGRQAVYVFFALSGFWVGGWVLRRVQAQAFSWREHLVRRLSRLWTVLIPALLVILVLDLLGRELFGESLYYRGTDVFHGVAPTSGDSHLSIVGALGNAAFLQGYWVHPFGTDGPLWSLGYEFWYYILFPLLLLLVVRRNALSIAGTIALIALCAVAGGPTALSLFPAWLLGVGAYIVSGRLRESLERAQAGRLGALQLLAAVAVVATVVIAESLSLPAPIAAIAAAITSSCFLVLASVEVQPHRILRFPVLLGHRVGEISYTLYAVHLPLILFLCAAINPDGSRAINMWRFGFFGAAALICVGVAFSLALITERHTARVRTSLASLAGWLIPAKVKPADGQPAAEHAPHQARRKAVPTIGLQRDGA